MIPVILIHKGYQDYLGYTLKQSLKNNTVHLLGDTNPSIDSDDFHFNNIVDYNEGCEEFQKVYQHLNTTPPDYELFCYQRWFILRNFMVKNNIKNVFYIDSDVLLFADVNEEWLKYSQFDMTLLHRTAATSSFITLDSVNNFCKLLMDTYTNKGSYNYKKIASHFTIRQECKLPGGVCDMTFLEYFHYHSDCGGGPGKVGEMMHIIDNTTYDHNINAEDQGFDFVNGLKNFKMRNGIPYIYNHRINKEIRFNALHFQGGAKRHIKDAYERCERSMEI
jgi:hypothetical protein